MKSPELADSIASLANKHIKPLIDILSAKYKAKVICGDVNELRVSFPDRSVEEVYEIAKTIVKEQSDNVVKLSFEHMLCPYLLISRNCFAGIKYKGLIAGSSEFVHKGLENIQGCSCPYITKVLIKLLKLLFETRDFSVVKQVAARKMAKILRHEVDIPMLVISRPNTFPESSEFSKLALIPRFRRPEDSVQYVVIESDSKLFDDLVVSPAEALSANKKFNAAFYLHRKMIPSLNELFRVFGVRAEKWVPELSELLQSCGDNEKNLPKSMDTEVKDLAQCKNCEAASESGCMNIYCPKYRQIMRSQKIVDGSA
eukprot:TRINITY_DN2774_c0_g1_i6.p1 TRINITY_DN2774_c0_g1~~TRINITY_DN2774_c0_g1_i6.p1  ORF type:complete len:313 (-),score=42.99 TRINITY_DN2774_c0_g1_i6:50-988(-)